MTDYQVGDIVKLKDTEIEDRTEKRAVIVHPEERRILFINTTKKSRVDGTIDNYLRYWKCLALSPEKYKSFEGKRRCVSCFRYTEHHRYLETTNEIVNIIEKRVDSLDLEDLNRLQLHITKIKFFQEDPKVRYSIIQALKERIKELKSSTHPSQVREDYVPYGSVSPAMVIELSHLAYRESRQNSELFLASVRN